MPTRIVFGAGESLVVREEAEAVVKGLEDISPGRADLLKLTRQAEAGTGDDSAVFVRPASVLYVTEA
jgi:hypothetical protein